MILCSTLHDAAGSLLDYIGVAAKNVHTQYDKWVVRVTGSTDEQVIRKLQQHGVIVIGKEADHIITDNGIEDDHLIALQQGLRVAEEENDTVLQYMDGDRVIMATNEFPDDFSKTAEGIKKFFSSKERTGKTTYLGLRRSGEDYLTHHAPLVQTELVFNREFSKVFGMPIDIGSTAHVMTTDIAHEIIQRSPDLERVSFPHPLWLIIAKEMGADIISRETHNIGSFETPLQFKSQVEEAILGSKGDKLTPNITTGHTDSTPITASELSTDYPLLQRAYMATLGVEGPYSTTSAAEWGRRFGLEKEYLTALLHHVDTVAADASRVDEYKAGIEQSLQAIDREREEIIDVLSTPEDRVRARIDDAIKRHSLEIGRPDPGHRKEAENY